MTPLQQRELELLRLFVRLCEQLQLRYYLVCGTALGAVKYEGFIPWDDDVDVAMPREDYEVFLEKAPSLLPEGIFLQNYRTDPAFPQIFSKLRNSNTTYIEKSAAALPINHGIFMDIFPLDGYPELPKERRRLEIKKKLYLQLLGTAFAEPAPLKSKMVYRVKRALGFHKSTARFAADFDAILRKISPEDSPLWCNHGNWQGKLEYAPWEQYGAGAEAVFEGLAVRIPERYVEYLTQKYGDYSQDPPVQEQTGHHYCKICDVDRPYTHYVIQKDS